MQTFVDKLVTSKGLGVVAGLLVILGDIFLMFSIDVEYFGMTTFWLEMMVVSISIIPAFIALVLSRYNMPGKTSYLWLGIIQTVAGASFGFVIAVISIVDLSRPPAYGVMWSHSVGAVAGCLIFLFSGIYLILNHHRLGIHGDNPLNYYPESRGSLPNMPVLGRVFTSKVPGVVAGLLVVAGNMILIRAEFTEWRSSFLGSVISIAGCLVLSIFPALHGLVATLHHHKAGNPSYTQFGIFQIILGLVIGFLPAQIYLPHNSYSHIYEPHYYYANLTIAGSLIFLLSGIYLLVNNARLSWQPTYWTT